MKRRGRPYEQQRRIRTAGIPRKPGTWEPDYQSPEYRAYARERYRNLSPKQRADRREYQRIIQEAKRREAGIAPRKRNGMVKQGHDERVHLSSAPFREWLLERQIETNWNDWCGIHAIDSSSCARIRSGKQKHVHIDVVDRVLMIAGVHLSEVYPDLYEEEMAA